MKNISVGVFCLLFSAVIFVVTLQFPDAEASYKDPAVYPTALLILIALIGVILVAQGYLSIRRRDKNVPVDFRVMRLPLILIGITVAYMLIMQIVGFILSTFLFLLLVFMGFGGSRRQGIVFSLILTAVEFALFSGALRVRLPEPIIEMIL